MPAPPRPSDEASTAAHLAPPRAQRLVVFCDNAHTVFDLPAEGTVLVGRGRDADVRIDDPSVSRLHAALHMGGRLLLEDMGSANGTKIDGRLLRQKEREPLAIGAIVEVGSVRVIACRQPPGAGDVSSPMARVRELVERVAPSDLSVVITGETGAGKEVLAEQIHARSLRAQGPLLRINCAALPDSLLESELFGHEKGAFTGAVQAKPGLFESANGGTVFLDEIGDLPGSTQVKILRVLENREALRVGGLRPRAIDVRYVVASHRDLDVAVIQGKFRQDLLFRLSGITIRIPPLRDRGAEIPHITQELLASASARAGKPLMRLSPAAAILLESYRFPGNVRELRQALDRATLLCSETTIGLEHLTFAPSGGAAPSPASSEQRAAPQSRLSNDARPEAERISAALEQCGGNQTEAAKVLGISRRTLGKKLDAIGMARPRKGTPKPSASS
jgi:two-component system response regulator AtoC